MYNNPLLVGEVMAEQKFQKYEQKVEKIEKVDKVDLQAAEPISRRLKTFLPQESQI